MKVKLPAPNTTLVLDGAAIARALRRIAHEIIERHPSLDRVALIGIPLRGVEIARQLAECIEQFAGSRPFCGAIDVSMHRDDVHTRPRISTIQPTHLPDELAGKTLILCDDVLFSGRTCRAAMDAISSFGRPARIEYAVLVDRGHRELPIRPEYVGKNLPTRPTERVFVRFARTDSGEDAVWVEGNRKRSVQEGEGEK